MIPEGVPFESLTAAQQKEWLDAHKVLMERLRPRPEDPPIVPFESEREWLLMLAATTSGLAPATTETQRPAPAEPIPPGTTIETAEVFERPLREIDLGEENTTRPALVPSHKPVGR